MIDDTDREVMVEVETEMIRIDRDMDSCCLAKRSLITYSYE